MTSPLSLLASALILGGSLAPAALPVSPPRPQLSAAASAGAPAAAPPQLAQRLQPSRAPRQTIESEHFLISFDPERLSAAQAEEARLLAEKGWAKCEKLFGTRPEGKLRLDLTPNFLGATGFARPGDPAAREERKRPLVGVRYAELDYLGLSAEYVLTHEIAHIFSEDLAGSALGEGIADWAAGGFSTIPLRPWWGPALQSAGLWVDPDALFITGDFGPGREFEAMHRTARYAESALLVQFLVDRYGWERTREFARDFSKAREALISNEERRARRLPPGYRFSDDKKDPRQPPDPEAVRAVFPKHFNVSWESLRSDWERSMREDAPPAGMPERLGMAQKIYGSVRNYEMWLLEEKRAPAPELEREIRSAFSRANRSLAEGKTQEAARALRHALALVEQAREPRSIA